MSEYEKLTPPTLTHEDDYPYPWKPFKSNGGTGDVPTDWLKPSTTVEPTPQPITSKLCPFRRKIYAMAGNQDGVFNTYLAQAEYFEEEFQPCLREQCMMWNENKNHCKKEL